MDREKTQKVLERRIDDLADIEHQRWAHWQKYMHGKAHRHEDGSLTIPPELVAQWERQINTNYSDLSEKERESDREQIRKIIPIIARILSDK